MNPIAIDPTPFYETRLIVLMESAPQSNHYHQIFLKPETFKNVSAAIATTMLPVEGQSNQVMLDVDFSRAYILDTEIKSMKL